MAYLGSFPVEFGTVFPSGAFAAGGVEKVRDFDKSSGERVVQQADKATGLPLWVVEVIDADPEARQRTVKVKVAAAYQPVLPEAPAGSPFVPVEFEGLTATPWVDDSRCQGKGTKGKDKCSARLAYSLKATGIRAPSRLPSRPAPECQFSAGLSVLGQSVGAGGGFSSEVSGTGRPAERGNGMVGGVLVAQDALDDFGVLN